MARKPSYVQDPFGIRTGQTLGRKLTHDFYDIENTDYGPRLEEADVTTDSLVIVPDSPTEVVVRDIQSFLEARDKFEKYGMSHRRGILLKGPPGTGKTSITWLVAERVRECGGVTLFAHPSPSVTSIGLEMVREVEPDRLIVLVVEDFERCLRHEEQWLSILDGQDTVDRLVVLATTNHADQLPPRILQRPSRFDRIVHVGAPRPEERRAFLQAKTDLASVALDQWVAATDGLMVAHLKELIVSVLCLGNGFDAEVQRLRQWVPEDSENPYKAEAF